MPKILCFVLLLALVSSNTFAQFEGIVELKMSTSIKPNLGTTKLYFSDLGGRSETEMKISPNIKSFKTVRFYKMENPNLFYLINDESFSYSESDLTKITPASKPEEQIKVKVIGSEKIQNYNCIHSIITTKAGDVEIWTTQDLMDYDSYVKIYESDVRTKNASFAQALIDAKAEGFPVKTIKKDSKGGTFVIELERIEKKSLSKSLFEVPAEYTKTETPTTGFEGMLQEIKQLKEAPLKEGSNQKIESTSFELEPEKSEFAPK